MNYRNHVPSLKLLATRKVAWPDGVNRKETDVYPCAEQYCREKIYYPFITNNEQKFKKLFGNDKLKQTSTTAINYWIQISNYYESTLKDFKNMELFLKLHPPEVIDFLHQGFKLSNEPDKSKIIPFIGVIPCSINPQSIDPVAWKNFVSSLESADALTKLKELYIKFAIEKQENKLGPPSFFKSYDFETTFKMFHSLTKLVVRGNADDTFLTSVGINCYRLKYLDISRSMATDTGVRSLFYKGEDEEEEFRSLFSISGSFNSPKFLLRPLTKTLEHFEMADMPNVNSLFDYGSTVTFACPQLVETANHIYFTPQGKTKMICRDFDLSPTFINLRQKLVLHVRTVFCEDIFCFVRGLLACMNPKSPSLEIRVDEVGYEIGFLLFSEKKLIAYCELENLTVINFTSYSKAACQFIDLELLGFFAPNLQRIKAPLSGIVSKKHPLKHIKFVTSVILHSIDTFKSIVQRCKMLQYLEVREILLSPVHFNDMDLKEIFENTVKQLEVFRILFPNKISVLNGLTCLISNCPSLRIIGDLKYWAVSEKTFFKLNHQLRFHNFRIAIEYEGVINYSDTVAEEIAR